MTLFDPDPYLAPWARPPSFLCHDCGIDVGELGEFVYTVTDDVWAATGLGPHDGLLCIGCLEARLGRRVGGDDFNRGVWLGPHVWRSARLLDRLGWPGQWRPGLR